MPHFIIIEFCTLGEAVLAVAVRLALLCVLKKTFQCSDGWRSVFVYKIIYFSFSGVEM
jgi:hypothetical protein